MVGLIAFANSGGLGTQTRRLAEMLNPDRVLIIDSREFSKNKDFNPEIYKDYKYFVTAGMGFPTNEEIDAFLQNLTHVFYCENAYNHYLVWKAEQMGIKTYCQVNYEFCENVSQPWLPTPTKFLMPSYWKIDEMKKLFGENRVQYLPPPLDPKEFEVVREINLARQGKPRFLHIIGTIAYKDRNGTLDLIKAVKNSKSDFELVIKTQHQIPMDYFLDDPRVTYDLQNAPTNAELYKNFDALLLPRRYGGLCLTTNEAMMSGLSVVMPDIEPNNKWLFPEWLVPATHKSQIMVKAIVDVYSVDVDKLTEKIDWICQMYPKNLLTEKTNAFEHAKMEFDSNALREVYLNLLNDGESRVSLNNS